MPHLPLKHVGAYSCLHKLSSELVSELVRVDFQTNLLCGTPHADIDSVVTLGCLKALVLLCEPLRHDYRPGSLRRGNRAIRKPLAVKGDDVAFDGLRDASLTNPCPCIEHGEGVHAIEALTESLIDLFESGKVIDLLSGPRARNLHPKASAEIDCVLTLSSRRENRVKPVGEEPYGCLLCRNVFKPKVPESPKVFLVGTLFDGTFGQSFERQFKASLLLLHCMSPTTSARGNVISSRGTTYKARCRTGTWWSSASTSDRSDERPSDLRRSGLDGLCGPHRANTASRPGRRLFAGDRRVPSGRSGTAGPGRPAAWTLRASTPCTAPAICSPPGRCERRTAGEGRVTAPVPGSAGCCRACRAVGLGW